MINILVRLHKDLNKFNKTINSILSQSYKSFRIIVCVDDIDLFFYTKNIYNFCKFIYIDPIGIYAGERTDEIDSNCPSNNKHIYGDLFIPNIYFNILHQYIEPGYILYLDNGDIILEKDMFKICSDIFDTKSNIIYQILTKNKKISPSKWLGFPVLSRIDSSSIMFHSDFIENWTGYRCGDFRVIKKICLKKNTIFLEKVLIEKDNE